MAGGTKLQRRSGTAAELSVDPRAGHRYELIDLVANGVGAGKYADINIGGKSLLRIYGNKNDMVAIPGHGAGAYALGLLDLLKQTKPGIPHFSSAQDEKLAVVYDAAPTQQSIYFNDVVGVDAVTHMIPGASDGLPRLYIAWVTHSIAVTADGEYSLDKSLAPVGFPAIRDLYTFAGFNFRLMAIIFASAKTGASTPLWLRMFDGDIPMFDDSRVGLMINADRNELKCDVTTGKLFVLEEDHIFKDKTQIGLKMYCDHDGANNIAAETELLGLVGLLEPLV